MVVPLLRDNVDTDQIIPARFLKVTHRSSLGPAAFADWRRDPAFVLEQERYDGAQILLTGENFGCGSSREHAAWALRGAGFRAVIATSFGDIFRQNALKNALLPVELTPSQHEELLAEAVGQDGVVDVERPASGTPLVEIDLERLVVTMPSGRDLPFDVDPFSRYCLLGGVDQLDYLLSFSKEIANYEVDHG